MYEARDAFGGKICARCGKKAKLTKDHFIPQSCGMQVNGEGNLVGLCVVCNGEKADKVVLPSWYVYLNERQKENLNRYMRYCRSWIKSYCTDDRILEYIEKIP